jgi:hypothetical protein
MNSKMIEKKLAKLGCILTRWNDGRTVVGGLGLKSDYWEVSDCDGNRWDFGTLADIRYFIEHSEARKNWPLSGQPCIFSP